MKDNSNFWVEDFSEPLSFARKRKRNFRSKRLEYLGWGSKPLIEFLESLGKDTSKKLSQYEVTAIVNEYVIANNLSSPEKKKKIKCDERLHALFGRKSVYRIKVFDLLEAHFAENQDSSEDEFQYSSEEEGASIISMQKKTSNSERKPSCQKKKAPETPKSCFAALIPENIKLVYLKRTLVQDLLKVPENFKDKVLGSFVRIKSDPNDYLQKYSHLLQQVIGVRDLSMTSEAGNAGTEVFLQLSNYMEHVPIHMLSDDNFSEEECKDLRDRVKAGLLKRPTVVELEAKAKLLHEDITKHWIPREVTILQKLIDRANEKGWRREFHEFLERKQLLQKPSEQERLLSETPTMVADELEPEAMPGAFEKVESDSSSSGMIHGKTADMSYADGSGSGDIATPDGFVQSYSVVHGKENGGFLNGVTCDENLNGSDAAFEMSWQVEETECELVNPVPQVSDPIITSCVESREMQRVDAEDCNSCSGMPVREVAPAEVIELSDDEKEVEDLKNQMQTAYEHPENVVWLYLDPQGQTQGPFSMASLKRWSDSNYFGPEFMVWKIGQSQDEAVLLIDVLRQVFP